jgi:cytochrome c5
VTDRDIRPTDPLLDRAVDALRVLPAVDRDAIARTVVAAARLRAEDAEPNENDLVTDSAERPLRSRTLAIASAAAVVIAAAIGIVVARQSRPTPRLAATGMPSAAAAPVIAAARSSDVYDAAPIPTQFVYDGTARQVALVGDFNGWDERATPLVREPGSALWSVTVPLQRGRHVYAFIVDSTWTTDRRAPVSRDPDFGVEGSVIIVGRP